MRRPDLLFFGLVVVGNAVFYSTFFPVVIESGNCSWFRVYFLYSRSPQNKKLSPSISYFGGFFDYDKALKSLY